VFSPVLPAQRGDPKRVQNHEDGKQAEAESAGLTERVDQQEAEETRVAKHGEDIGGSGGWRD